MLASPVFNPVIVVLAAGNSKRFAGVKLLADIESDHGRRGLLENTTKQLLATQHPVIIATGKYHDMFLEKPIGSVEYYFCTTASQGMGNTIAEVCGQVINDKPTTSHIMLCVADQPALTTSDYQHILTRSLNHPDKLVCAETKVGFCAPTVFPKAYFCQLQRLHGDKGAKSILHKHKENVLAVGLASAITDIDTQQDLDDWNNNFTLNTFQVGESA